MKQLSLFTMEERAAIIEHDGKLPRHKAEQLAGYAYTQKGAETYILLLIENREPLIHLWGANPHICKIRTFSSYEPDLAKQRGWIDRGFAVQALSGGKYVRKGNLSRDDGVPCEIWHFEGPPQWVRDIIDEGVEESDRTCSK